MRQAGVRTLQDEAPQTSASGERREGGLREEACRNQPDFERRSSRHCFARELCIEASCCISAAMCLLEDDQLSTARALGLKFELGSMTGDL